MEPNELNALSALLAEDDFAKGVALGISAEKAEALNRLRALRPWQDERYSNSDIGNGYLVPDSMEAQIVQTLAEENVMRRLATVIHMEDGERAVPVVRSMSEAQWLDENEAMEMGAAGFEAARLKPRKLGLTIPVSNELLADAGVDMAAFLADTFARRIASGEEKAFLTGDGVKQPAGLLNSAQVGVQPPCRTRLQRTNSFRLITRWTNSTTPRSYS